VYETTATIDGKVQSPRCSDKMFKHAAALQNNKQSVKCYISTGKYAYFGFKYILIIAGMLVTLETKTDAW
jgi:hypothetical protein